MRRFVGELVRLLDGQRVHVGAQHHALALAPPAPPSPHPLHGDDAGLTDAGLHLVAEALQPLRDERAGARLLEPKLRMLMQVAARGDEGIPVYGREG